MRKICKMCDGIFGLEQMKKGRAICLTCYVSEYKKNYIKYKPQLKEKRIKNINKLIEENKLLKEELEKTKTLLTC